MTKKECAILWMEDLAADNSHGYSQVNRWGPDYDCSSAVITAWKQAGVNVGAATYTGNMRPVFLQNGFVDVTDSVNLSTFEGIKRADVLLNIQHHVAMACGSGLEVEASQSENGGIHGQTGDQTGGEILVRALRNYPWDCVLRYVESDEEPTDAFYFATKEIGIGSKGIDVYRLQLILKARGYYKGSIDRCFGSATAEALKKWKAKAGLTQTGTCDRYTWHTLLGLPYINGKYKVEPRVWHAKREADKNVLLVQELLKGSGYFKGKLSWNFSRALRTSIKKFQKATKKLDVNGKIDIPTLKWLIGA